MKKTGKSIFKVCMCLLLVVTMLAATTQPVCATTVSSQAKKAVKAYQKFLKKKKIKWSPRYYYDTKDMSFAVVDVDKDGIPELFLDNPHAWHTDGWQRVYTFYRGKVKELCTLDQIKSYYPKSGVVEMYYLGTGDAANYIKIQNGECIASILFYHGERGRKPQYYLDTQVSKSKFQTFFKKNVGTKKVKVTKSFWHKNTSSNRKNMLKMVKW